MGINDSERSQTPQIGVNCFHTIDSAENRDGEIALRTAVYAAGKADDAALRIDAEPAAPEGRLEVKAAEERITLLHPAAHDYYRLLRSKLQWGRGGRDLSR